MPCTTASRSRRQGAGATGRPCSTECPSSSARLFNCSKNRGDATTVNGRVASARGEEDSVTIQIGRRPLLLALMLVAACCARVAAQSGSGVAALEGVVTDPDNRAIPDALVLIVSNETGYERAMFTDTHGRYFAPLMPVGSYTIDVSAKGFAHVEQPAVRLTVGATETRNFSL